MDGKDGKIKTKAKEEARTAVRFGMVGVVNTIVGCSLMFGLYNLAGWGYWLSSATNFAFTSVLSYVLNKKFTFRHSGDVAGSAFRFAINIAVCYLLAYGIAKPLTLAAMSGVAASCGASGGGSLGIAIGNQISERLFEMISSTAVQENVALIVGLCLFTVFNYLGQRFFAFRGKRKADDLKATE